MEDKICGLDVWCINYLEKHFDNRFLLALRQDEAKRRPLRLLCFKSVVLADVVKRQNGSKEAIGVNLSGISSPSLRLER